MSSEQPASIQLADTILETLLGQGISHVVLAPGSRSAALAQLMHRAAEDDRISLHVRIDERDAGFLALGLAKALQRPVPVLTTSGTAVGNLLPAVMEAHHSAVALMVISADRPVTLQHSGANQTTDQHTIFGGFVRGFSQVSSGEGNPADWQFQVDRLLAAATGVHSNDPGPVHLNAAFTPPLVSGADAEPVRPQPITALAHHRTATPEPVDVSGAHTVVIAGDATPQQGAAAVALAKAGGFPLLAEPSSNARVGPALPHYRLLLERDTDQLASSVRHAIVFGHPTLSRPVATLLGRTDVEVTVVAPTARWIAPGRRVDRVVAAVRATADDQSAQWLQQWHDADQAIGVQALGAQPGTGGTDSLDGVELAAAVVGSLGPGDVLVLGSSNPIRDADLAEVNQTPPRVYANRGLAGIDGTISTAAGVALATGAPTTALLGDLTFQHDLGGLIVGPLEQRPDLRLVVANDDGGSIFATLEYGDPAHAGSFERVFGTPQGIDLGLLATGAGASHRRIGSRSELAQVLAEPPRGIEVVEVPVDRAGRRSMDRQLRGLSN